ncbi:hypothetical protein GCM10011352_25130 [Marinobacterium zhoushanense]|uniref:Uncharacterized protein n=1 Tax=Marinobacterium zhoushanense TaxID=1679163 RepID=A0ABQ1KHS6_9GAMM|nr:hypothetical protein [Marinobacterium zhoushanense]GGB97998.1 hypothetical protein GCM10011352_25130 [Marinobacterium zhoushanense]
MFEAHYSSQELSQADYPLFGAAAEPGLTRRLHSHVHQCPLHVWAAQGKRKDDWGRPQPRWFLYIEYCRRDGARDWILIERPCSQATDDLFDEVPWLDLREIDPKLTREWLDADHQSTVG